MRANWPPPIWLAWERPARKWLGRFGGLWISAAGVFFFLFLLLVGGLLLHNGAAVTVGLLVGSVTVAGAFIYTMAYRIGPRDTLGLSRLLIAFGLGGLVSVTVGSTFDSLLSKAAPGAGSTPSLVVLCLAGISEELAKILAVVLVSRKLADKSMRNGLFLGGAVGLGFAALEDLAYAVNFYENPPAQLHLTHLMAALVLTPTRAILTPLLHPIYTALLAAALFSATRGGRFRITWRVVLAYLGVALAHGIWDGSAGVLQLVKGPLQVALAPLVVLIVYPGVITATGLIWIKVARRARYRFHTRVLWWLAPPPVGAPAAVPPAAGLAAAPPAHVLTAFAPPSGRPVLPPSGPASAPPLRAWPDPRAHDAAPGSAPSAPGLAPPPTRVPGSSEGPESPAEAAWPPPASHTRV
ncbi:PrsW family intramembrane metalloprotease [Frondihabitans peucedani]|uniref:RsiW-degrading membrane proteinase PrsW (M82 family) n=1 Tax=Frondihabitans peucedani TaxID=598626 RepID=A0ABP8DZ24_9MICO